MKELVSFFKALSDETRFRIFSLIISREMCVCEIVEELKLSQSLISHHLYHLKAAGLVKDRREGVWIHYSVNQKKLDELEQKLSQELRKAKTVRIPGKIACKESAIVDRAKTE
jgi:DNA-binding transcriptional ArsR family regulator